MAASNKDTIYIDIDDEITGIIDKLRASNGKIVALVLPKRASVFQSIVNMKLLKRAADESKKNLVLITSEAGLLPLAGASGIHVAKTLTSKPEIPTGPASDEDLDEVVDQDEPVDQEVTSDTETAWKPLSWTMTKSPSRLLELPAQPLPKQHPSPKRTKNWPYQTSIVSAPG
jgi:hypothetical protein